MSTKIIVGLFFVALVAYRGVDAGRSFARASSRGGGSSSASASSYGNGVAYASSSSSNGGRSKASATAKGDGHGPPSVAKAESVADNCGADSTSVSEAKNGAHVQTLTHTKSKDCAKVKAKTVAKGDGVGADIDAKTVVVSDKDIDISVYVKKFKNGHDVKKLAAVVVKKFDEYKYPRVATALLKFASHESTYGLYEAVVRHLFDTKGCDAFKLIIKDHEKEFIVYKIHDDVAKCLFPVCSVVDTRGNCCGAAQLTNPYCSCFGDKCGWQKPTTHLGHYTYWDCLDCASKVPLCACI